MENKKNKNKIPKPIKDALDYLANECDSQKIFHDSETQNLIDLLKSGGDLNLIGRKEARNFMNQRILN